jgi:pimeloyl-ACP methyl ester carboxylesterase
MLPLYEQLAARLNISVLGYDYPGYGRSTPGPPAASAARSAAAAVFAAAAGLGFPPARVVLYGQSVGSGPAAWLGAREAGVAGVVLHSAFLSGVRVLRPGLRRWPAFLDVFPNASAVPKIASPVLVVHGEDDAVVGAAQGRALVALCRRPAPPLFAAGAGHDDLEAHPQYLPTLKRFLDQVLG